MAGGCRPPSKGGGTGAATRPTLSPCVNTSSTFKTKGKVGDLATKPPRANYHTNKWPDSGGSGDWTPLLDVTSNSAMVSQPLMASPSFGLDSTAVSGGATAALRLPEVAPGREDSPRPLPAAEPPPDGRWSSANAPGVSAACGDDDDVAADVISHVANKREQSDMAVDVASGADMAVDVDVHVADSGNSSPGKSDVARDVAVHAIDDVAFSADLAASVDRNVRTYADVAADVACHVDRNNGHVDLSADVATHVDCSMTVSADVAIHVASDVASPRSLCGPISPPSRPAPSCGAGRAAPAPRGAAAHSAGPAGPTDPVTSSPSSRPPVSLLTPSEIAEITDLDMENSDGLISSEVLHYSLDQGPKNGLIASRDIPSSSGMALKPSFVNSSTFSSMQTDSLKGIPTSSVGFGSSKPPSVWQKLPPIRVGNPPNRNDISLDGIAVVPDLAETNRNINRLQKAVVGKIMGRNVPLHFLKSELGRKWAHLGKFDLIFTDNNCFIVIFESSTAREEVLFGGPWIIAGSIVGLDVWTPTFCPASHKGFSSPIWIRFPRLPLIYWGSSNLTRFAAMIGTPIWLDGHTDSWDRCSFARVCVRMDLSQKLPTGIWIEGQNGRFFQKIEYEGITHLCFHCGLVGHKTDSCPSSGPGGKTSYSPKPDMPPIGPSPKANALPMSVKDASHPTPRPPDPMMIETPDSVSCASDTPPPLDKPKDPNDYGPWTLVMRKPNRHKSKIVHPHTLPPPRPPHSSPSSRGKGEKGLIGPAPPALARRWRPIDRPVEFVSGGSFAVLGDGSKDGPRHPSRAHFESIARRVAQLDKHELSRGDPSSSGGGASLLVSQ